MRTTLDLDDDLMIELLRRLPGRSKTSAIEQAIAGYLDRHAVTELVQLAGTLDLNDASTELRALDRSS